MHNIKPLVLEALESVEGFKDVFQSFPDAFKKLPVASFYEAYNAPQSSADDDEYLSEITVVVDVWAKTSGETSALAVETNDAMKRVGFVREFASDINDPESDIRHKTMRFRLIK